MKRIEANPYRDDLPPIARDGWCYVAAGALITAILGIAGYFAPALFMGLATLFVSWFFRDPRRISPQGDDLILSPADGTVLGMEPVEDDPDIGKGTVVSIFMSVFSVHVNRCPISGTVKAVRRHPGKFLAAYKPDAPEANERTEVVVAGREGSVKFVQIAGLVARRIVCRLRESERVTSGQRYGLIKFGSRLDLYVPANYRLTVGAGDKVKGALTVIARLHGC